MGQFINQATGEDLTAVGHGLDSETAQVAAVRCCHPDGSGRNVVLLDTPGFGDTYMSDFQVILLIVNWLDVM